MNTIGQEIFLILFFQKYREQFTCMQQKKHALSQLGSDHFFTYQGHHTHAFFQLGSDHFFNVLGTSHACIQFIMGTHGDGWNGWIFLGFLGFQLGRG